MKDTNPDFCNIHTSCLIQLVSPSEAKAALQRLFQWSHIKSKHKHHVQHIPCGSAEVSSGASVGGSQTCCANCGLPPLWVEMSSWNNHFLVLFSAEVSGGGVRHAVRCDVALLVWPTPAASPSLRHWRVSVSVGVCVCVCVCRGCMHICNTCVQIQTGNY